jgi:hypothetical protein
MHAKELCCRDWRFGQNSAQLGAAPKATQWASSYPFSYDWPKNETEAKEQERVAVAA